MISISAESQTESRKWSIKVETIVTLGIMLLLHGNSAFGRKMGIYMERVWWWWWLGLGVRWVLLRCRTTCRPLPVSLIQNKWSMLRKLAEKQKKKNSLGNISTKKPSLCDSLNKDAEWRESSSRCFAVWGLQILSTWLKTWRFTFVVWRKPAWTGKTHSLRLTGTQQKFA